MDVDCDILSENQISLKYKNIEIMLGFPIFKKTVIILIPAK